MGKTLKFLADLVDAKSRETTLIAKDPLGSSLVKLVFASSQLRDTTTDPCDVTAIRISRNEFRHYTPARIDPSLGEMTIFVEMHGQGPGDELIDSWQVGQSVRLTEWSSTRTFTWPEDPHPVVLAGDATVISLATAMTAIAGTEGRDLMCVLEVDSGDVSATQELLPDAVVIARPQERGTGLTGWFNDQGEAWRLDTESLFYLAGHGQSTQRLRDVLRKDLSIDRKRIKTQPYWATGKTGL